ncbi:MAG: SpoIID/LytB domain-containing protein [Lachnospiraceae bacterium]
MKKFIINFLIIAFLPLLISFVATLVTPKLWFGMGSYSVKDHLMGKKILVETKGLYKDVDVEEYIVGVMATVIPPDYDMEALKVQAVLIRTNVLKEIEEQNTYDSKDLTYTYLTREEREKLWGERKFYRNECRMEQAVSATAGQVIYYKNELIMALYHEVSIGRTASGKEILDEDIPYLQSVESNQDVEANHYMNIQIFTKEDYDAILEQKNKAQNDENSDQNRSENKQDKRKNGESLQVLVEECSENGFVKKLRVENEIYDGKEAMELFGLPSMNFYVEQVETGTRFVCLGKGNCLGVSMYGANYMAQNGSNYRDIISYYYKDVHMENYN